MKMIDNVKKIIPRIDPDPKRKRRQPQSQEEENEKRKKFENEIEKASSLHKITPSETEKKPLPSTTSDTSTDDHTSEKTDHIINIVV